MKPRLKKRLVPRSVNTGTAEAVWHFDPSATPESCLPRQADPLGCAPDRYKP
jgi:hypothetical protein